MNRNDHRDADVYELKLIRVGHALWAMMKRDRAQNRRYLPESDPIWKALENVWDLKRQYRAELAAKRIVETARLRERFRSGTQENTGMGAPAKIQREGVQRCTSRKSTRSACDQILPSVSSGISRMTNSSPGARVHLSPRT